MARSGTSGKKKFQARLITLVAADDVALRLLEHTKGSAGTQFEKRLRELAKEADPSGNCTSTTATRTFVNWCKNAPSVPRPLSSALARRATRTGKGVQNYRRKVIADLDLNWKKANREEYLADIEVKVVKPLRKAPIHPQVTLLPSPIVHTTRGSNSWRSARSPTSGKQNSHSSGCKKKKLAVNVACDESVIFKTTKGKLVAGVLRDFCPSEEVVKWVDTIIAEALPKVTNIRPAPEEVIDDFDTFLAKSGIKRMDGVARWPVKVPPGHIRWWWATRIRFPRRRIGSSHRGFWSKLLQRPDAGGNFYLAKYGIRVEAAPNTLVFWMPAELHGTSLLDHSPYDAAPDFIQRGAAIVTSNRLPGVWKKYRANEASGEIFDKEEEEEEGKEGGDEKGGR
ncbi:hypothetical protein FPV67DRAFT_1456085 [Lyophyllum atratum]|nr:hypothetical protein FPV67DRAFT_1456085 [Lyophyllum atratum]